MRSYQNFALGVALLLFATAVVRTAWVPRPIVYLMGLSGLTYLVQGWVAGYAIRAILLSSKLDGWRVQLDWKALARGKVLQKNDELVSRQNTLGIGTSIPICSGISVISLYCLAAAAVLWSRLWVGA